MQKSALLILLLAILLLSLPARAIDQAMPGDHPSSSRSSMNAPPPAMPSNDSDLILAQNRDLFQQQIHLNDFRLLAIQHRDQLKIIDSWARQSLKKICNRETWNGQDPLYTALDMMIRPEAWNNQNIIFIQAIPIREQLTLFAEGSTPEVRQAEARRILETGLVSPRFIDRPEVQQKLQQLAMNVRQADSVGKISSAIDETLNQLLFQFNIVPPAPTQRDGPWNGPVNFPTPEDRARLKLPPIPGYSPEQTQRFQLAFTQLILGWRYNDAPLANQGLAAFTTLLPNIDASAYPSHAKRLTELWYNRTFYGTIANVFLYFISMTLFLLVAVGVAPKLRRAAYSVFSVAVILHIASMGVRLWLAGRWPTQNQFESVLGAALLGCIVGWLLESWKKNALFGMAFSFVGFLAMTACMAAPYMFGTDLGGAISKTAGILQTYWLYIHVNIVISSYALISASFILGVIYLLLRQWHWINPLEPGHIAPGFPEVTPHPQTDVPSIQLSTQTSLLLPNTQIELSRAATLATLDQANMVILQLAFWFLGIGVICGAVWADHSWGRPWGWDPKETFALITWMVYLIIVHVRIALPKAKADTTAWLSIAGFAIMMFNWIGVNFFLAGLHSYA